MSRAGDTRVATRYASALFAAASKLGKSDAVESDLAGLESLWNQAPALRRALESPLIPGERKHAVVDAALADIDELSKTFLHLLIEKRREEILPAVKEEFGRQADDARGLIRAEATTAVPLADSERAALVGALQSRTGKTIELSAHVDAGILGGLIVRMEDTVIDGSVRGALERLREQMMRER